MAGADLSESKEKTLSISEKKYAGSKRKYVVFLCAFMFQFFIGAFQTMMSVVFVDIVRSFDANRSEASIMLSISGGLLFAEGSACEYMMRRLGFTRCVMSGCLLVSVSLFASAFASSITTIVILVGIGTGSGLTLPMLASFLGVSRAFGPVSFPKYMAYTLTGSGVGSIISPYVAELLLNEYGWRGTFLILSGVYAHLIVFSLGMHYSLPRFNEPKTKETDNKTVCSFSFLRNSTYITLLVIDVPFGLLGFFEYWYVPDYVVTIGYTRANGTLLLTVIGASGAFGRLLAGIVNPLCTYTNTKIIYYWIVIFLLLAAGHAMFPLFPHYQTMFAASIIYGITFSMIFSQASPIIRDAVCQTDFPMAIALHNTVYGIFITFCGLVAGLIKDSTGSYNLVFYLASGSSIFCSLCCTLLFIFNSLRPPTTEKTPEIFEITHF